LLAAVPSFERLYEEQFAFVWRNVQRLGVRGAEIDDAVQEVFIVVHRKLADYQPRSSVRAWVFGILTRVVRTHRRTRSRKEPPTAADTDMLADGRRPGPEELLERSETVQALEAILDTLTDEQCEVFILVELEEMSGPEVAEALAISVNTVYSRLRLAREHFQRGVTRYFAQRRWES